MLQILLNQKLNKHSLIFVLKASIKIIKLCVNSRNPAPNVGIYNNSLTQSNRFFIKSSCSFHILKYILPMKTSKPHIKITYRTSGKIVGIVQYFNNITSVVMLKVVYQILLKSSYIFANAKALIIVSLNYLLALLTRMKKYYIKHNSNKIYPTISYITLYEDINKNPIKIVGIIMVIFLCLYSRILLSIRTGLNKSLRYSLIRNTKLYLL